MSSSHCAKCHRVDPVGTHKQVSWIECDVCTLWYHTICVGFENDTVEASGTFKCDHCDDVNPSRGAIRKSKRTRLALDYASLDDKGRIVLNDRHLHSDLILNFKYSTKQVLRVPGTIFGKQYLEELDKHEPVLVPANERQGLDLEMPVGLTVRKVSRLYGENNLLEVIDVPTQNQLAGWTLRHWADYYETPQEQRDRIRNVISLEISNSELAHMIRRPKFVRDMDLVDTIWPVRNIFSKMTYFKPKPKVSLYCLMSTAQSFTDFHVDFGGSSVFYHLLEGKKTFLFIRPTKANLEAYETWCLSKDQDSIFLADKVPECIRVDIEKYDTLYIPSGWIHAVYTLDDSLVIGGNFLTLVDIPMQISVSQMEWRMQTSTKYRYPHFEEVLWYTAQYYIQRPFDYTPTNSELGCLKDLAKYLYELGKICHEQVIPKNPLTAKLVSKSLPSQKCDPILVAKALGQWCYRRNLDQMPEWCLEESNGNVDL